MSAPVTEFAMQLRTATGTHRVHVKHRGRELVAVHAGGDYSRIDDHLKPKELRSVIRAIAKRVPEELAAFAKLADQLPEPVRVKGLRSGLRYSTQPFPHIAGKDPAVDYETRCIQNELAAADRAGTVVDQLGALITSAAGGLFVLVDIPRPGEFSGMPRPRKLERALVATTEDGRRYYVSVTELPGKVVP